MSKVSKPYDPKQIEKKWQGIWDVEKANRRIEKEREK